MIINGLAKANVVSYLFELSPEYRGPYSPLPLCNDRWMRLCHLHVATYLYRDRGATFATIEWTPTYKATLGNGKYGLIRGVVSREGYIRYNHTQFVLLDCGLIRGVASVEIATYRVTTVALYTVLTSCHTTNVILLYIRVTYFVLSLTSIDVTDVISDCHTICLCHNSKPQTCESIILGLSHQTRSGDYLDNVPLLYTLDVTS